MKRYGIKRERKEKTMETREYCDNVVLELGGWKTKVDDVLRKFDRASTGYKEKVVGEVNGLHIIAEELDDRLKGLCNACMTTWEPQMEDHDIVWPEQSSGTWNAISESDFGG
jgi:hypothetical protein